MSQTAGTRRFAQIQAPSGGSMLVGVMVTPHQWAPNGGRRFAVVRFAPLRRWRALAMSAAGRVTRRLEDLPDRLTQPCLALGEVGIGLERRQDRVVGFDPRRLEDGVILERFRENLPADRIDRAVLAG